MLSRLFSEAELAAWAGGRQQDRPRVTQKGEAIIFASCKKNLKKSSWEFIIATGVNFKTDTDGLIWEGKMRVFYYYNAAERVRALNDDTDRYNNV